MNSRLNLIDYPPVQSSPFFSLLMKLHQQALRPQLNSSAPLEPNIALPATTTQDKESEPWLAPKEAQASGFIALEPTDGLLPETHAVQTPFARLGTDKAEGQDVELLSDSEFSVGVWVEILSEGEWTRTQLTWTNPKGNMFLFTGANGTTQSMTRRSRDQMMLARMMRLVSGQRVVDDALDAVVHTALRNSIDSIQ